MTVKYEPRIYAPLYEVPASERESGFIFGSYETMRAEANRLTGYVKTKISTEVALNLADRSPYPEGVKLAVRKQLANENEITLSQMRIFLGWAARRAQHTGRL